MDGVPDEAAWREAPAITEFTQVHERIGLADGDQQNRQGSERIGDFELDRDARAVFRAPSDDILLIKVNYWLNP